MMVFSGVLAAEKFWILDPLYIALGHILAFFYALIPSYGFAIIMLTVAVSILRMPLVAKQVKSQQAMQRIQPELKRIQAKFKAEPQKRNEELMKLYKEHNVNPFAGCLPLLLQMPLFIVLYRTIINLSATPPKHIPLGSELYGSLEAAGGKLQDFGMDLAQKASSVAGVGKIPYLLLVALVVGTGLVQSRQMSARLPKDALNNQMAIMTKILPVFLGVISWSIPAGVVLYFIVGNLWTIGQQYFLFRHQVPGGGAPTGKGAGKGEKVGGKGTPAKAQAKEVGEEGEPGAPGKATVPAKAAAAPAAAPAPARAPARKGFLARLAEAANQTPADRSSAPPKRPASPKARGGSRAGAAGGSRAGARGGSRAGAGGGANGRRVGDGGSGKGAGAPSGSSAGSAKPSSNGRASRPSGRAQPPGSKSRNRRGK